MTTSDLRALRQAWLTELQAIAIYRGEESILRRTAWTAERRKTLRLVQQTLEEECLHQGWIEALPIGGVEKLRSSFLAGPYRIAGGLVGVLLSILPSRLCWKLHQIAEAQAERAYLLAARLVTPDAWKQVLLAAAQQEREHSERFARAMSGDAKDETL